MKIKLKNFASYKQTSTSAEFYLHRLIQLFMFHLAAREYITISPISMPLRIAFIILIITPLLLSLLKTPAKHLKIGMLLCCSILTYKLIVVFPFCSNHFYIEYLFSVCLLLLFTGRIDAERIDVFNKFIVGIVAFVLIASGGQKLIAGTYLNGVFLASQIRLSDVFASFFRFFDSAEVARIKALSFYDTFYFENKLFLFISCSIPIAELFAGVLLFFKRTRIIGVIAGIIVLIGIEIVAREMLFGLFFLTLITYHLPKQYFKRLIPFYGIIYLVLIIIIIFRINIYFN